RICARTDDCSSARARSRTSSSTSKGPSRTRSTESSQAWTSPPAEHVFALMNRREFLAGAVTLPLALRFTPDALGGGNPVALVTADTESRVAVVELSTGKVIRSISTLPDPRSIESISGIYGVVCHTVEGAVSVIDGRALQV